MNIDYDSTLDEILLYSCEIVSYEHGIATLFFIDVLTPGDDYLDILISSLSNAGIKYKYETYLITNNTYKYYVQIPLDEIIDLAPKAFFTYSRIDKVKNILRWEKILKTKSTIAIGK